MSENIGAPAFLLHFNGSRLAQEREAEIEEIRIIDRADYPSSFIITINEAHYDWRGDSALVKQGIKVKISLGWKDEVEEVLTGEITKISIDWSSSGKMLILFGYSLLHRLNHFKTNRSFADSTDKDILLELFNIHQIEAEVCDLPRTKDIRLQYADTDYEFLLRRLDKYDTILLNDGEKVIIKKIIKNASEDFALEWGKSLKSLGYYLETDHLLSKATVYSYNQRKNESVMEESTHNDTGNEGQKTASETFGKSGQYKIDSEMIDATTAAQYAKDIMTRNSRLYCRVMGECGGNPQFKAGKIVKLITPSKRYPSLYLLKMTTHILEPSEGYTIEFYAENYSGNAGNDGLEDTHQNNTVYPAVMENQRQQQNQKQKEEEQANEEANQSPEITNLQWKDKDAGEELENCFVGEIVTLNAEVTDIPDGQMITITIYEKDKTGENDKILTFQLPVKDAKISQKWRVIYTEDTDDETSEEEKETGYTRPEYVFQCEWKKKNIKSEFSPQLNTKGTIVVILRDKITGEPLKETEYIIYFLDGKTTEGKTDEEGYIEHGKQDDEELKYGNFLIVQKEKKKEENNGQ